MVRLSWRRPLARATGVLTAVSLAVAACGQTTPSVPPAGTGVASSTPPAASAVPSPSATARGGPAAIDPSLLGVLPPTLDGLDRQTDPQIDAQVAADPALSDTADGFATAIYVDPAAGLFAYASVIRLRTGVFSEEFYRDWRDSFDEGACAQASGVAGHAEAEIAGRLTYVGSCAGGLRTYHTYLPARAILVSVSAPDERRLGEAVMQGLVE